LRITFLQHEELLDIIGDIGLGFCTDRHVGRPPEHPDIRNDQGGEGSEDDNDDQKLDESERARSPMDGMFSHDDGWLQYLV
jgi:hypothetical protein